MLNQANVMENGSFLVVSILESCTEYSIIATDLDAKIIAWNEGACRLYSYDSEEMVGKKNLSDLHSPEDVLSGKSLKIQDTVKQAGIWRGELKCRGKGGKPVFILSTITLRTDPIGKPIGYTIIDYDQTEFSNKLKMLTESKEYTRSLIESNIDVLITTDSLGIITDVNRQFCEMTGKVIEELIGSPFKLYFTDPKRAEDLIRKVLSANRIANYELVINSPNNKQTPVSFNVTTFHTIDGHLKGIFTTARDITEQKRLEEESRNQSIALLKTTNLLNDVLKSSIAYSMIAQDLEGTILLWNEGAKRNYGYIAEEMVFKKKLYFFNTPEDIQSGLAKKMLDEALKTGRSDGVVEHIRKNGERFPAMYSVTTRRDEGGSPVGYVIISKDITIQKQQEQELREQLSYNRSLFESSIDVLIATDTLGIITDANKQMCALTGYKLEELVGTELKNYFTNPKQAENCIRNVLADEIVKNYEITIKAKDDKKTVMSCNATTFKGTDKTLRGVFVVARDITDQKREEVLVTKNVELVEQNRLAQEANRLKSEFLANMSHELRSPLNGIIGFAELMHLGKVGPVSPEHKEYLADILSSSRHLLQLINDILDLAKVESGKMEFHPETIDINGVITDVCDILRTLIAKSKIQLSINVDVNMSKIIIDPAKLKQVLYNYISNAIKFTQENGTINIRVSLEGADFFRLEVEDSGIGISEHDIPKLFAEFQQLDSSLDKKYQGTGLGLALTRRIAEALGGQVGVKSVVGKGSTFYIILPREPLKIDPKLTVTPRQVSISDESTTGISTEPKPNLPLTVHTTSQLSNEENVTLKKLIVDPIINTPRILVIEDNSEDNQLIVNTLTNEGYVVDVAFNGAEAIKLANKHHFDLITLDLLLPDMNGWEVLRAFRSKGLNLETPSIVVTVVGSKAISFGFMIQNFLTKPIKSEDLIKALEQTDIYPNANKTILFVDDDPQMLSLCKQYVIDYGSIILCESSGEKALTVANIKHPDVIILDLLMPEMDGLEFLRRFRTTEYGKNTPVIICTSQDMGDIDRKRIKASVAAVVQKGGGSMSNLVTEIQRICPTLVRMEPS